MTRHLRPFVCDQCHAIVDYPEDRRVISLDSMDPFNKVRYRRVMLARLCLDCASAVYEKAERGVLLGGGP